jgi:hypothetical protein
MAKSRRKSGSCTRGRFKLKKLGKGWSTARKARGSVKPLVRDAAPAKATKAGAKS